MLKLITWAGASLAAFGIAGCSEYLDRRDTLLLGAGEAVQTNIVTHQIDPWPAHAQQVYADTSGERVQHAMERYRNPQTGSGALQGGNAGAPFGSPAPLSSGSAPIRQ